MSVFGTNTLAVSAENLKKAIGKPTSALINSSINMYIRPCIANVPVEVAIQMVEQSNAKMIQKPI